MAGLDLSLLVMVGLGAFLGLAHGLTGEILSVLRLAVAAIVSALILQNIQSMLPSSGVVQYVANGALGGVIFFVCNLVLGLITFQLNFVLSAIVPDMINRPSGMVVGAGKMFIIASVLFFLGYSVASKFLKDDPGWIEDAKSKKVLLSAGGALAGVFVQFKGIDVDSLKKGKSSVNGSDSQDDGDQDDSDQSDDDTGENQSMSLDSLKSLIPLLGSGSSDSDNEDGDEGNDDEGSDNDSNDASNGGQSGNLQTLDALQKSLNLDDIKKLKDNFDNLDGLLDSLN